ncbi:MAG: pre-peptidase C-terminal domain-containing protein [Tepidisphaeraceae bacterium]
MLDPSGTALGTATASGPGLTALLNTLPVTTAGTYTIKVESDGSTSGNYAVTATLNGLIEAESAGGSGNDTVATAQDLTDRLDSINGGPSAISVLGTPDGVNGTTFFSSNFENGLGSWVISNTYGSMWHLSTGRATQSGHSATTSLYFGTGETTSGGGTYNNGSRVAGTVTSPSFLIPAGSTAALKFNYVLQTEGSASWDNSVVSISTNGTTFTTLTQLSGVAESTVWRAATPIDLSAYAGQTVQLRFSFDTFDSIGNSYEGWYVDDVVVGAANPASVQDVYSVSLNAGESLSVALKTLTTGSDTLKLLDPAGAVLATGASGATNVDTAISSFVAPTAGKYYIQVSNSSGAASYNLVVARNYVFSLQPHDTSATAQNLASQRGVIGYLSTGADWYSLPISSAGSSIAFSTATLGDRPGEFNNTLDPHIELYDPSGNLVASGATLGDGRNESISYAAAAAGTYRIKVTSQAGTSGEYTLGLGDGINVSAPTDLTEGDTGKSITITASTAPSSDVTINLASSNPSRLTVPATVLLPAGQTSVTVPIEIIDDAMLNGPESISISANATGYFAGGHAVRLHDNETATLTVTLPSAATEGGAPLTGTVTASAAPTRDIVVALASSAATRLGVPATITILAGQTTATFTTTTPENTQIDGNINAAVNATVENWQTGSATVAVADNDATMTLTLPTATLWEGQTASGTITIGGTLATALVVSLASTDATELTLPATVTIPAGQTSATFTLTLPIDALKDGSQTAVAIATASGLPGATGNVVVHDATVDRLTIDPGTGNKTAGVPFTTTARAYNIANEQIANYAGTATLTAYKQSGTTATVTPTSATFSSGLASISTTLTVADPGTTLMLTSGGASVTSTAFAVVANSLASFGWNTIGTPKIANVPFNATATAYDAYGNVVTGFNGSTTLSAMVGTTTSQAMLGNFSLPYSTGYYTYTYGYDFTPNTSFQVTHVRSYFGQKVSIWSSTGTLLTSQTVTGTAGTWTETALTSPLQLTAGITYRVGLYFSSSYLYYAASAPTSTFATIGSGYYYSSADARPTTSTSTWVGVDLRGNVGAFTTLPLTPTSATFVNGVWTGAVSIGSPAIGARLRVSDASSHIGDSNTFDVLQRLINIGLPTDVLETDGSYTGELSVTTAPDTDLEITLTSADPTRLSVPATIIIPAGQTSVPLTLTILDDTLLNGPQSIVITATASGYPTNATVITVHDDEVGSLSLSVPTSATEGTSPLTGTVTASVAPTRALIVKLTSANTPRATVPATVTILAGQLSANFAISILDNTVIDGSSFVSIGAAVEGWLSAYKTVRVQDNDATMSVSLSALNPWEGQTGTGTVTIGGTLTSPLVVSLLSDDTTELTLPATITIPAGQTSATFTYALPTDGLKDGSQVVHVTPTASGLSSTSATLTVHDVDLDHFAFDPISGTKTAGTAFAVVARAYNVANEVIPSYAGTASLFALVGSVSHPVSPTTATFASGVWNGSVSLNFADTGYSLRLASGVGIATSNTFTVQAGAVTNFIWNTTLGLKYAGIPFTATATAYDDWGNIATSFNGSAGLSALVGTTASQAMIGNLGYASSYASSNYTLGYNFTPTTPFQVTHVRSFFGTKVSIWTSTGTVLASQAVAGTPGTWTETALATPLTLSAGVTYRVGCYVPSPMYYYFLSTTPTSSFATIGSSYYSTSDSFPSGATSGWYNLDLRGNVGAFTTIPVTPSTATFMNGVWTGPVSISQAAASARLHVADSAQHVGDSNAITVLQPDIAMSLPTDLTEGAIGVGTVTLPIAPAAPVSITLSSADAARLGVPATVVVPAGQKSVTFDITAADNALLDGLQSVIVTASATGMTSASAAVAVHDNESTPITVTLPATVPETDSQLMGTVTLDAAPTRTIVISLTSSDTSRLLVPSTLLIPAGQTQMNFYATIVDDAIRNGSASVNVSASMDTWPSTPATVIIDDDEDDLVVTLPSDVWEGTTLINGGSVRIGGAPLAEPLTVTLVSDDLASLILPATVTIPAGANSVSFDLVMPADTDHEDIQAPQVIASAAGSDTGTATMRVHDATLDHIQFIDIDSPQKAGAGFWLSIRAANVSGELIPSVNGTVVLTATGTGGAPISMDLSNVALTAGSTNDLLKIFTADPGVTLSAQFGSYSATSKVFAVQPGALSRFAWDSPSSNRLAGVPFSQTVSARDAYGNLVSSFAGTITVATGQPGVNVLPGAITLAGGTWTGDLSIDSAAVGLTLRVSDASSHEGVTGPFDVVALLTPTVDLMSTSDSGISSTDDVTKLNNAETAHALTFEIGNTDIGATVTLFADGVAIGSTVAMGSMTTIVTNGTATLADGSHTFTAKQSMAGRADSATSNGLSVSVDTTAPTISMTVARSTGLGVDVGFNELVTGDAGSITLTNSVTGEQIVLTTSSFTASGASYRVASPESMIDGSYVPSLGGCTLTDAAGNVMSWSGALPAFAYLRADFNGDGTVNFTDLLALAASYGNAAQHDQGDANFDGTVNFSDLLILAGTYGNTITPPAMASAVSISSLSGPSSAPKDSGRIATDVL